MKEKNGNKGKQRKAAPAKQTRSKNNNGVDIATALNIASLSGPNEHIPNSIITLMLFMSVAAPFLPRAAAARNIINNNTSVPDGKRILSTANNSTYSAVSVVNSTPPLHTVEQTLPIIPMQYAVADKRANHGKNPQRPTAVSITPKLSESVIAEDKVAKLLSSNAAVSNKKENIEEKIPLSADLHEPLSEIKLPLQSVQDLETIQSESPIKPEHDLDMPLVDNSQQLDFRHFWKDTKQSENTLKLIADLRHPLWLRSGGNPSAPLKFNPYSFSAPTENLLNSLQLNAALSASDCHAISFYTYENQIRKVCIILLTNPDIELWGKAVSDGANALILGNRDQLSLIVRVWNFSQREQLVKEILTLASQRAGREFSYSGHRDDSEKHEFYQQPYYHLTSGAYSADDMVQFVEAISKDDRATFIRLLDENKVDVALGIKSHDKKSRMSILQAASAYGNAFFVDRLLSEGVDVNEIFLGQATLHYAIKNNAPLNVIEQLLLHGADPLLPNDAGETAIHLAAQLAKQKGSTYGSELLFKLTHNSPSLSRSSQTAEMSQLKHLKKNAASVSDPIAGSAQSYSETTREVSTKKDIGSASIPRTQAAGNGAQTNIDHAERVDLLHAIKEGDYQKIEQGILAGTAIEDAERLLFLHAVQDGNYQEVERRILAGVPGSLKYEWEGNSFKHNYMEVAAIAGQINIVKLLKKHGVDINALATNGFATPLAMVIYSIEPLFPVSYIEEMIELGAKPHFELPNIPVNARGILIANPVFNAIFSRQRLDILKLFLAKKYIKLEDAFQYALLFPHRDAVEYLIKKGINLYTKKTDGSTYLHLAVKNNLDSVKHILELAPNLNNVGDNKGDMPLHVAAARNELEMVQLLLKAGAHPGLKNRSGRTAAELASAQKIKNALLTSTKADSQKQRPDVPKMWSRSAGNPDAPLQPNPFSDNAPVENLFTSGKALGELSAKDCHVADYFTTAQQYQRYCLIYLTEPSMDKWDIAVKYGVRALINSNRQVLFKVVNMWGHDQRDKLITAIVDVASQQVGHRLTYPYVDNDIADNSDYFQRPHILIKSDSFVFQQDQNKFIQSIKLKDRKTFDELIAERKVDITGRAVFNQISHTILQLCVAYGDAYCVEKLLSLGVDVNEIYNGCTALYSATVLSRLNDLSSVIKVLLRYGADPRIPSDKGDTAIAFAKNTGNREVLKLLSPTTYVDPSPPILSKQNTTTYIKEVTNFVYTYLYVFAAASIFLLGVGSWWWFKKKRDNELKIKQFHIMKHEEYVKTVFQSFFNVEQLSKLSSTIEFRLIMRSSAELQRVLRDYYSSNQLLPNINVDKNVLINHLTPILARFYGDSAVKWQDDTLSVEIVSVLQQTPAELKKSDFMSVSKTIIENSPEFRDEQDQAKRLAKYNTVLKAAKKTCNDFEANLQGFRDYIALKKITLEMLDNCTEKVGKTAAQVRTVKLAMNEINKLDEEYKKNKNENDKIYAANGQLSSGDSTQIVKQKVDALKERAAYYDSKNKLLLKFYDGEFVKIVDDLIKDKKLLSVAKITYEKQESKKSSSTTIIETQSKQMVAHPVTKKLEAAGRERMCSQNDEEEIEENFDSAKATSLHEIYTSKLEKTKFTEDESECHYDDDEIECVLAEEENQSNQNNLELKPPTSTAIVQTSTTFSTIQSSSSVPVVLQPTTTRIAQPPSPGGLQMIVHDRNMLFARPPVLSTPKTALHNRPKVLKAPQRPVPLSPEELVKRIKDHALGLSVLVATVQDYDFSIPAERIIYRYALFYHLLRLLHGMWLLKLGNPDESINLKQIQKMRNLVAHYSKKTGKDELFIFASEIRNELFRDTQVVGTRKKQKILNDKFRDRIKRIDIKETDLYKNLLHDKQHSVISENDCYVEIEMGIQDAQNIFKVVEGGETFANNPDRSAAIKGLLAIIGDNFMQIRDCYPENWEYLANQLVEQSGEKYFEDFIVFRNRIYHYFMREVDINNYDLYQEARSLLCGENVETILAELKKGPSQYTLSPPKA